MTPRIRPTPLRRFQRTGRALHLPSVLSLRAMLVGAGAVVLLAIAAYYGMVGFS